jgi:hypothetical protein
MIRILDYQSKDGKDMFLVEYPGRGQRWVFSIMIGGQYKDEKAALKYRYEQKLNQENPLRTPELPSGTATVSVSDITNSSVVATQASVRQDVREPLKCICQQTHAVQGDETINCSMCLKKSHVKCVRAEGITSGEIREWQCPFCRLLHMDPFNPGVDLLMFTTTPRNMLQPSAQEGTLTVRFNVHAGQAKDWEAQKCSVSVRCVAIGPWRSIPKGPLWPREVTATVNSFKDVFKILPGKYGHVRREVASKEVSDMIRPNANSVSLQYRTEAPSPGQSAQPPRFVFAVVVASAKGKKEILSIIKRPSEEECQARDVAIVRQCQYQFDQIQKSSDDLVVQTSTDFDIFSTRCPLSLCEMDTPVRGIDCEHIQAYDAESYIDVNLKTRNVEKRWKCPVCSRITRPEDLIVDEFVKQGMEKARKEVDIDECGLIKRFKLHVSTASWEILPDEAIQGQESESEDEYPNEPGVKKQKVEAEIILDDD